MDFGRDNFARLHLLFFPRIIIIIIIITTSNPGFSPHVAWGSHGKGFDDRLHTHARPEPRYVRALLPHRIAALSSPHPASPRIESSVQYVGERTFAATVEMIEYHRLLSCFLLFCGQPVAEETGYLRHKTNSVPVYGALDCDAKRQMIQSRVSFDSIRLSLQGEPCWSSHSLCALTVHAPWDTVTRSSAAAPHPAWNRR